MKGKIEFGTKKVVWMYFHLAVIVAGYWWLDFEWMDYVLSIILGVVFVCLGHSVGLHRGVIHQSYQTAKWLQNTLIYFSVLAGLGSPINWMKLHFTRDYWQNQPNCPPILGYDHSIFRDYWWNLHVNYVIPEGELIEHQMPKFWIENRWFQFLSKTWILHNLLFALVIGYFYKWEALVLVMSARIYATIIIHWLIGYFGHTHGEQRYVLKKAKESGYNNWLLGVISFGEGFHNTHHAYPQSAQMGQYWYELDLGYYVILVLEKMGLVQQVHHISDKVKKELVN